MFSINGDIKLKKALDDELCPKVKTYESELPDLAKNPKEFIVYSVNAMKSQTYWDDYIATGNDSIILRYYHAKGLGLKAVRRREREILKIMVASGFTSSTGSFELGDIDDIGYKVTGFEFLLFSEGENE